MTRDERAAWLRAHGHRDGCARERCNGCKLPPREPRASWLVAPFLAPLIERLSRGRLGWCNATYHALRIMVWLDTGYVFGEASIGRWVRREFKRGKLRHVQCRPGWHFHRTGFRTHNGTTLNRFPSEAERREQLWRAKIERRRQRRDRARLLEAERARRIAEERAARRARAKAPELLGPPRPRPALVMTLEDTSAPVARAIAATVPPPPASSPSSTRSTPATPAGPSWAERIEAAKRAARGFARELGEPLDDEPPEE